MKLGFLTLLALLCFACNSSPSTQSQPDSSQSYGTPEDCTAAGGQCVTGSGTNQCAKQGPANTCNCNPGCNPSGDFCCVTFIDAGAVESGAASDASSGD